MSDGVWGIDNCNPFVAQLCIWLCEFTVRHLCRTVQSTGLVSGIGDITAQLKDGIPGGKFALTGPLLLDFKSHNTSDSVNHYWHVLRKPYTKIKNEHYGKLYDIIWLHDSAWPNVADGLGPTCHKMGGA